MPSDFDPLVLITRIRDCNKCALRAHSRTPVPPVGSWSSKIMVVGRNPGAREDEQGEPFVGRSGQLLNDWLAAAGLTRAEIFITNLAKCHSISNTPPSPEMYDACIRFLIEEIQIVKPRVIIALGRPCSTRLGVPDSASLTAPQVRYKINQLPACVIWPIMHPGGVLRKPGYAPLAKRKFIAACHSIR